jgi:hypothetical protein
MLALVGCCANQSQPSDEGQLVYKTVVHYHHSANCAGHEYTIGKIDFQIDGHDMWLLLMGDVSTSNSTKVPMHSPDCQKCKSDSNLTEEVNEEINSTYWGW